MKRTFQRYKYVLFYFISVRVSVLIRAESSAIRRPSPYTGSIDESVRIPICTYCESNAACIPWDDDELRITERD